MTSLIACLDNQKGTTLHVKKVIEGQDWEKIFLITENNEKLETNKEISYININSNQHIPELTEEIKNNLQNKIPDTEVALNIIASTGKIHTALLSAILKLGLGIRLIALTTEGVREI